jgi:hypothetical protein
LVLFGKTAISNNLINLRLQEETLLAPLSYRRRSIVMAGLAARRQDYFTFSMLRSARPNRKMSTPEISFWMALAVETALGTMGTGFCPA